MTTPRPAWSLPSLLGEGAAAELVAAMSAGEAIVLRGEAGRFAGLFDEPRLRAALARMAAAMPPGARRFGAVIRDPLGDGLTFTESIEVEGVEAALAAGHTICATDVAPFDADLDAALAEIAASFAAAADLRFNAYLSPAGARTPLHTDVRISTSLQLAGRKRWRYARRAAVAYPRANAQIDRFGDVHWMNPVAGAGATIPAPAPGDLHEVDLDAGDLICVPAGAWHEVLTLDHGLGLNLSVRPTPFAELVHLLVDAAFAGDGAWRSGLPLLPRDAVALGGEDVPSAVASTFAARVAELRAWLDRLDPAGPEVAALWRALTRPAP